MIQGTDRKASSVWVEYWRWPHLLLFSLLDDSNREEIAGDDMILVFLQPTSDGGAIRTLQIQSVRWWDNYDGSHARSELVILGWNEEGSWVDLSAHQLEASSLSRRYSVRVIASWTTQSIVSEKWDWACNLTACSRVTQLRNCKLKGSVWHWIALTSCCAGFSASTNCLNSNWVTIRGTHNSRSWVSVISNIRRDSLKPQVCKLMMVSRITSIKFSHGLISSNRLWANFSRMRCAWWRWCNTTTTYSTLCHCRLTKTCGQQRRCSRNERR
jgi:hypothetical protein